MFNGMERKNNRRPVIDPLLLILKSRRVLIAFVALLTGLLVTAVPALAAVQDELLVLLVAMALAVIGGYSLEDAASERNYLRSEEFEQDLHELVEVLLEEVVDVARETNQQEEDE